MHSLLHRALTLHVLILLAVLAEWDVLLTCPKRWVDGEYTTLVCEIKRSSINNKCKNPGITAFRQTKQIQNYTDTKTRCAVSVNDQTYCNNTKSKCRCGRNATHFIYLYQFKIFGVSHEGNWSCKRQCNEAKEDHFAGDNPLVSQQSDGCFGVHVDYSTIANEIKEEIKLAVETDGVEHRNVTPALFLACFSFLIMYFM